jgi:hypothetical protein
VACPAGDCGTCRCPTTSATGAPRTATSLTRRGAACWRAARGGASLRALDYGSPEGFGPLREAIAGYASRARGVRCGPDDVVVVNGSQQALDLAARVLVDPGDAVVLEEPHYAGARRVFEAAGARLRSVAVDADGLRVEQLPRAARLAYVTPSHQFPTGAVLPVSRRLARGSSRGRSDDRAPVPQDREQAIGIVAGHDASRAVVDQADRVRAIGRELHDVGLAHRIRPVRAGAVRREAREDDDAPAQTGTGTAPALPRGNAIRGRSSSAGACRAGADPGRPTAAVRFRGVGQRDPAGQVLLRLDERVSVVLVPREVGGRLRLLVDGGRDRERGSR